MQIRTRLTHVAFLVTTLVVVMMTMMMMGHSPSVEGKEMMMMMKEETINPLLANPVYVVTTLEKKPNGYHGFLKRTSGEGPYGGDVDHLELLVEFQTEERLHVKITDAKNKRWEVPSHIIHDKTNALPDMNGAHYSVNIDRDPFALVITRKSDGHIIFDTRYVAFIYEDQFLTMGTNLKSEEPHIYGLGERAHNFRLDPRNKVYTIHPRDWGTPISKNLYGTHPFYIEYTKKANGVGTAHGVFLLNSNAMDIKIDGPNKKLHFMTIGGVLDFYFFSGPSPANVVQQYQKLVGFPAMPPFWALGFHQCRWGYGSVQETREVVENFRKNNLPLDCIWNDIDYMDEYKDFTTDPVNFPLPELQQFIKELHSQNLHYTAIIDPAIKIEPGYEPYDEGMRRNIFIRTGDGKDVIKNTVWPGLCVFPDFENPATHQYWHKFLAQFIKDVPVSSLWIDMNEPAGFCDGSCEHVDDNKYNFPPYVPGGERLIDHTLSLDARGNLTIQYNSHSLYGLLETISTYQVLEDLRPKQRHMIISRSTFSSSGRYAGHWLGDNQSTWSDLFYSISGVLSMNMFGIPFVGADVCGFAGDVSEELCARWMQLGALYPFDRNHNNKESKSQEPYALGQRVTDISRSALEVRYSLLAYMYTLMHDASHKGAMVWNPMVFAFPNDVDPNLPFMDRQFMVGDALLAVPVVDQGATKVTAYFPDERWYDFYTGVELRERQTWGDVEAPLVKLPLFVRGGTILIKQEPALNTVELRKKPFELVVALNDTDSATGALFLDDGVTDDHAHTCMVFNAAKRDTVGALFSTVNHSDIVIVAPLDNVSVLGLKKSVCTVNHDGKTLPKEKWHYDAGSGSLRINNLGQSVNKEFNIQWAEC